MTLEQALRAIELLNAYGTAKFGDEWWPGNAAEWIPDGKELEELLDPGAAAQHRTYDPGCPYTLSHTRHWCGRAGCSDG